MQGWKMQDRVTSSWMNRSFLRFAALGLALAACWAAPAAAQGVVKSKFGDWEMRCETPAGASREQCALIQSIAAED